MAITLALSALDPTPAGAFYAAASGSGSGGGGAGGGTGGNGTSSTTATNPARAAAIASLEVARTRLRTARGVANVTADQYAQAESRLEEVRAQLDEANARIARHEEEEAALTTELRRRAVAAYTGRADDSLGAALAAPGPAAVNRRARFLKIVNAATVAVRDRLEFVDKALAADRATLEEARTLLEEVRDGYQSRMGTVAERRERIREAARALLVALDAAIPLVAPEEAAALTAERAEVDAILATATGAAGQVIANRASGPIQCPVAGAAYSDDFYRGRVHPGIDMLIDTGAPVVAARAGSVSYIPFEGAGGNAAYLTADDGNVYYYAHLSAFIGPDREVVQGEVIGLVGSTGNSTGPHLHFEARIGGVNGERANPYPLLIAAGC